MATKIGLQNQALAQANPWWRNANWHTADKDLKAVKESQMEYRSGALDDLEAGSLYILRGPRRVGKTVAVKQAIKMLLESGVPEHCLIRVSADGWISKDLKNLVEYATLPPIPEGAIRYWFIDEVSAMSGTWAQEIKWLRDENPEFAAATVVLTGSNSASLTEAAGILAGRRGEALDVDRTLLPMGFASFANLVGRSTPPPRTQIAVSDLRSPQAAQAYEDLIPWLGELVKLWETYLQYGGFPLAVAAAKNGKPIPQSFINTMFDVIQKDAFKSSRMDVGTSTALQEKLWKGMASPLTVANLAHKIGVTHDVVTRHMQYLRDAFLLWNCPKRQATEWLPLGRGQDKVYAIDPIIARLPHLRNVERQDIDPTILTEMQIGMALRRRLIADFKNASWDDFVFYFTSNTRKEIDFISSFLKGTALEGKYIEDEKWKQDAATVEASEWDGIMATRNVLDITDPGTWAVPAAFLCYLLDT